MRAELVIGAVSCGQPEHGDARLVPGTPEHCLAALISTAQPAPGEVKAPSKVRYRAHLLSGQPWFELLTDLVGITRTPAPTHELQGIGCGTVESTRLKVERVDRKALGMLHP